ncbi:unnamed protein product, partial [Discosporangium mesarthrocarpum]
GSGSQVDDEEGSDYDSEDQTAFTSPQRVKSRRPGQDSGRGKKEKEKGQGSAQYLRGVNRHRDDPHSNLSLLSRGQFWRYRCILEVVLSASGGGGGLQCLAAGSIITSSPEASLESCRAARWASTPWGVGDNSSSALGARVRAGDQDGGDPPWGEWEALVLSSLARQVEEAEDGLLAGMALELLSALALRLGIKSAAIAKLAWGTLRRVFPRGCGRGYLMSRDQFLGLDRSEADLLSCPLAMRALLERERTVWASNSRLKPQFAGLVSLPPWAPSAWSSSATIPSLRQCMLTHWALAGAAARGKGLAAVVCDLVAFILREGKEGKKQTSGTAPSKSPANTRGGRRQKSGGSDSRITAPPPPPPLPILPASSPLSEETFDMFFGTALRVLPPSLVMARPRLPGVVTEGSGQAFAAGKRG